MRSRPRAIVIAISIAVALPVLLLAWIGVDAAVMPACSSCHLVDEFGEQTAESSHAGVACSDCHGGTTVLTRLEFGANQVLGMHLPLMATDPTLADVGSSRCTACHADDTAGVVENNGLRVLHEKCAFGKECTSCHSGVAHGRAVSWARTVTMDGCYDCHDSMGVTTDCDTCHTARLPSDRAESGTFAVTHGPNYLETHGMGRMSTCAPCHDESKCARCHGGGVPHDVRFMSRHGREARSKGAKCTGCHREEFCSDCHQIEMPHDNDFTAAHPDIVERDGQELCDRCHAEPDCTECHVKHVHPTSIEQQEAFEIEGRGGGQ